MRESCPMLGSHKKKKKKKKGSAFSVCWFCHSALQSFKCVCVCVCGAWTHVCIHKAHFPSSRCSGQLAKIVECSVSV